MTSSHVSPGDQRALALIRISLLVGVLIFGALTWWLQSAGDRPTSDPSSLRTLRIAGFAIWGAAIALLAFLRSRLAGLSDSTRRSYLVISWGVAEAVALFGGVVYFLSGDARWYVAGLFFMIGSFLVFPLRKA
ncbi:MAG: hypothetical protein H0W30_16780 [Gemmatimonadaceae bacterium]|nr:hypothetical protein [Gemmatimonadaceae bacterium]MDQ3519216.1 hypothetical protein [Gemmatimonadota bacterium]